MRRRDFDKLCHLTGGPRVLQTTLMSSTSITLPRGIILGTCFAFLLGLPLFFAISLDSRASAFRYGSANSSRQRLASSPTEFFDRQLTVQAFVGPRSSTATMAKTRAANSGSTDRANSGRPKPLPIFQIRVENRSANELSVDVLEAKSEFGDLSAGLQTIRLAPGQMTQTGVALKENSLLKKPSPVQVTLRLGDREEQHSLLLAPVASR